MFIWRYLHNVAALKVNLSKFISMIDPSYPLCEKEMETIDHFFFNCEISQLIWFGSLLGLRTQENKISIKDCIGDWCLLYLDINAFSMGSLII